MLTDAQVAAYNDRGFLRGSKILSDDQVGILQEEVERVIRDRDRKDVPQPLGIRDIGPAGAAPLWQIGNIWQASQPFFDLISHQKIVEEVAQLTGANELRIWHDQIQYKTSSGGGVNMWHQDAPYWPILKPLDLMLTAWVALDDIDEENGCMSMVPHSHQWGDKIQWIHNNIRSFEKLPADCEDEKIEAVLCPVPKGVVHYHHSLTWHGSNVNRSTRPRRAIALHYLTDQVRYHAAGGHMMKQFVTSADGELLRGTNFPTVWQREAQPVA